MALRGQGDLLHAPGRRRQTRPRRRLLPLRGLQPVVGPRGGPRGTLPLLRHRLRRHRRPRRRQVRHAERLAAAVRGCLADAAPGRGRPSSSAPAASPSSSSTTPLVAGPPRARASRSPSRPTARSPPAGHDWITVSPKAGAPLARRPAVDELKLVYPQAGAGAGALRRTSIPALLSPADGRASRGASPPARRGLLPAAVRSRPISLQGSSGCSEPGSAAPSRQGLRQRFVYQADSPRRSFSRAPRCTARPGRFDPCGFCSESRRCDSTAWPPAAQSPGTGVDGPRGRVASGSQPPFRVISKEAGHEDASPSGPPTDFAQGRGAHLQFDAVGHGALAAPRSLNLRGRRGGVGCAGNRARESQAIVRASGGPRLPRRIRPSCWSPESMEQNPMKVVLVGMPMSQEQIARRIPLPEGAVPLGLRPSRRVRPPTPLDSRPRRDRDASGARSDCPTSTTRTTSGLLQQRPRSDRQDVVGFSCQPWNIDKVHHLSQVLKLAAPDLRIVWGGPEAGFRPTTAMVQEPAVFEDVVVCGEGEVTFVELLQRWLANHGLEGVLGIAYRDGGRVVLSPREGRRSTDLDMLPSPYLSGALDPKEEPESNHIMLEGLPQVPASDVGTALVPATRGSSATAACGVRSSSASSTTSSHSRWSTRSSTWAGGGSSSWRTSFRASTRTRRSAERSLSWPNCCRRTTWTRWCGSTCRS